MKQRTRSKLIFTALLVFLVSMTFAQKTVTHSDSGLKFDLPDDWTTGQEGDSFATSDPDQSVLLIFFVGKAETASALLENIAEELDGVIEEPEITSEEVFEEEINGLLQVYIEGTGIHQGDEVDFDLTLVVGGPKSMAIIALGDIDGMQDTVDEIYSSIRK
ncbi:hypothetical protein ACFLT9_10780 [Acidobacteriota bacterium]